jgi:hypothetical protein
MTSFAKLGSEIFRDYTTDGVPASGAWKPGKADIRQWLATVEASTLNNIVGYGAVADDDGSTDQTTAVTAADADAPAKYVPDGIYDVTLADTALDGPYWGRGQIRDSSDNLRAPWFSAVKTPPASFGVPDSASTAFSGDLSHVQIAMEHRITGASTLGIPSTGYNAPAETAATFTMLFNSSGHNEATDGNDGRTAAVMNWRHVTNAGQGDCMAEFVQGIAVGTRAGSTHFLANPAVSWCGGALFAGADGVFLNPVEFQMHDSGFDAAALGWNMIMNRTNATGAKNAYWAGFRVQSEGSQPIDVGFSVVGPAKYGLDLVHGTFTDNAAISLKQNHRIYGNAVADSDVINRFPSSHGTDWIEYSSSLSGWNFIVGNSSILQLVSGQITANTSLAVVGNIGFFGHAVASKPTVTGSRGGNAALASLLIALAGLGLLTDSSS